MTRYPEMGKSTVDRQITAEKITIEKISREIEAAEKRGVEKERERAQGLVEGYKSNYVI